MELEHNDKEEYKHEYNYTKKYKKRNPAIINEPITSYGLILYSMIDNFSMLSDQDFKSNVYKEPIFLLYQRRDSFEYMDFLRGLWKTESQLPGLFSSMSEEERMRISDYTFKELWDDLWVIQNSRIYKEGFSKAKKKYDSIKNIIPDIISSTTSCIIEPPWGFPKGKKNGPNEHSMICAVREFEEETHINVKDDMKLIQANPFIEKFKGSNGKIYSTHYYLAEIPIPYEPKLCETPNCIRKVTISEEASKVKWFKFHEACQYINPIRQNILKNVMRVIEEDQKKEKSVDN